MSEKSSDKPSVSFLIKFYNKLRDAIVFSDNNSFYKTESIGKDLSNSIEFILEGICLNEIYMGQRKNLPVRKIEAHMSFENLFLIIEEFLDITNFYYPNTIVFESNGSVLPID